MAKEQRTKALGLKVSDSTMATLAAICETRGQTKTAVIEEAIAWYAGLVFVGQRLQDASVKTLFGRPLVRDTSKEAAQKVLNVTARKAWMVAAETYTAAVSAANALAAAGKLDASTTKRLLERFEGLSDLLSESKDLLMDDDQGQDVTANE